ncbi:uncharacterized protein LOC132630727 [Lycium barbarum]|uniref:uncharacterized protein LOC132630727 n=1 Tax=Lycium barbarum TaxID=112863 RepID=UPI00293F5476|nr:uncharacterized protein LOC132630727 [Lycium barbarum]
MDVIGSIEPAALNGHRFILVSIDYFTKWVEATSHKSVTKKVVADFMQNIICRFGIPESIIIDNGANLNSHMMKDIYEQFKITHRNSIAYRPQMNEAIEATNKNIKRVLRKMTYNYKGWHEKLSHALLGYRTTAKTLTVATPNLLVYGTKAVIPAEVEIPSLRIIQKAELDNAEWVRARYEQLALIDEKKDGCRMSRSTIPTKDGKSLQQTSQDYTFTNWADGNGSPKKVKTAAEIRFSEKISSHKGHEVFKSNEGKISSQKGYKGI